MTQPDEPPLTKHCPRCKTQKTLDNFYKNSARKDRPEPRQRYQSYCKPCWYQYNKATSAEYRKKNYRRIRVEGKRVYVRKDSQCESSQVKARETDHS